MPSYVLVVVAAVAAIVAAAVVVVAAYTPIDEIAASSSLLLRLQPTNQPTNPPLEELTALQLFAKTRRDYGTLPYHAGAALPNVQ